MTKRSLRRWLLSESSANELDEFLNSLGAWERARLEHQWNGLYARKDQLPPESDWNIWLLLGGRGSGKTRAGAEWVRSQILSGRAKRVALVAPTLHDAREVMLFGDSGLMNLGCDKERPSFITTRRRLEWPNGAVAQLFSAEDPDSLRGPQFDAAWADEFCAWSYPEDTLSNLRLGLRLGNKARLVMTTTPRPIPALKGLLDMPGLVITRSRTASNAPNLSHGFVEALEQSYGGSHLARQEMEGELLFDHHGGLWSRRVLERVTRDNAPELDLIVMAIDPPVTAKSSSDSCGIIIAGRAGQGANAKAYVLADATVQGRSPEGWASHVVKTAQLWGVDVIVAEVNQGGDMVQSVLKMAGCDIPIKSVFAQKSKTGRAEPVALLYEQGRVFHAGVFSELEDELCALGSANQRKSPDRADALVWAIRHLLLRSDAKPQLRNL